MSQVFLLREYDPETNSNKFSKVVGELDELRKTYTPITLNKGTDRAVTILMQRATLIGSLLFPNMTEPYAGSKLDPTGLVPSFCAHGLTAHPVTGAAPRNGGSSWVSSRLLTVEAGAGGFLSRVKCHCEHVADPCGPTCPARRVDRATGEILEETA